MTICSIVHIGYSYNGGDTGFMAKLSLWPNYRYIQIIAMSKLSLCPSYRYVQIIAMSKLSLCPNYRYIQIIAMAKLSLCPNYRYGQIIAISKLSLYPILFVWDLLGTHLKRYDHHYTIITISIITISMIYSIVCS